MENRKTVLVTGGTGAVGICCILQLLQKGYDVKTTLRSIGKKNGVIEMLRTAGIAQPDHLQFIEADLTKDSNWNVAMKGCQYVLHIASPTHAGANLPEDETIRPAVEGTLRVLKAARDAGVKRVVMTSSFGAVGFSNKNPKTVTTESDWTDPDEKGLSVYEKSKVLAEKAAWDFIKKEGGDLELTVINPVAVFGPSLALSQSPSLGILKFLTDGSAKAIPNIPLNVVDIRDVADLHVRAMTNPNASGHRFIATADGEISMPEIAKLLKDSMPEIAKKVPVRTLPNWVLRIAALVNPQAKQSVALLTINRNVSNAKAKKVLGWQPIATKEEAILAAMESLVKYTSKK
ncbi:aldehyde reductase [Algoriphagus sp. AGSA1]|uniref:SDR family oxidoreductase n=1 Tax=Algoriphagus sp. AGSA1 TaxID=2907213 RepID=UPI001F1B98FD|nr:aldehyde reductase [Algoriphagus sp. AGSA1]MCE7053466.1 aldehyde reductase [Algoriphagus sp. AGSA1]